MLTCEKEREWRLSESEVNEIFTQKSQEFASKLSHFDIKSEFSPFELSDIDLFIARRQATMRDKTTHTNFFPNSSFDQ